MARRALRGVQEVTRTATEIANGALDRRVEVRSQGDELDTLARAFNTMVDRIQALVIGMREMTDNLAHDLRSPLGRIRASAETSLTSGGSKAEAEAMAAATTEECDRLLEIINTTLDIAEAESGAAKLKLTDIDLVELVHDALELFQPIAEDKQITITADLPDHCHIHGDRQRLQRVVANLLDNGLKYMPVGGRVTIKLVAEGERVTLSIEDTGIGISSNESARIFERFYRCDRSRSKPGNGLGLSLALAFVRAHGGDITVNSTQDKAARSPLCSLGRATDGISNRDRSMGAICPERLFLDPCEERPDLFVAELREAPLLHVPLAFGEFRPEPVQLHLINEFFIVLHETRRLTDHLTDVVVKARSDLMAG